MAPSSTRSTSASTDPVPAAETPTTAADPVPVVQKASLGRVVFYRLTKDDAIDVNHRRTRSRKAPASEWGFQGHRGNRVAAGEEFSATVVRVDEHAGAVNLQVQLDGNDTLWVTSVFQGEEHGQWYWPPRV